MATAINHWKTLAIIVVCLLAPILAHAQRTPPPAYQLAAHNAGVPSEVLYVVALTESGIRIDDQLHPWPWTLNIAGQGRFFRSKEDACFALMGALKTVPAKRVDIGLGQINYGYHGTRVNHPCDLLDPYLNLSIAADILLSQHQENQGWLRTIGRYHSPADGDQASRYANAANRHLVRITSSSK